MSSAPTTRPAATGVAAELESRFADAILDTQATADGIPTLWITPQRVRDVLRWLKSQAPQPYRMLYDLTALDERVRKNGHQQLRPDFSVLYHLFSFERNADIRLKVALHGDSPTIQTITDIWPAANWYEREVWDMFGIRFEGHPDLRRILNPPGWVGHPLRKDHPARATDMPPFLLSHAKETAEQERLRFHPEEWGLKRQSEQSDFMFLNLGPHHPGTHGVLRLVLQLDGEEIVDVVPDIGYHHRGQEKMGERQSWHSYIPYTDRIDYLGGVTNNLPYVLAVERLAGITVPPRAQVIRVMLSELFRIISHLVWYGTFSQDLGQMSPVFYMFTDRERAFSIIEAICGARMHPNWFRIGGVADDLPQGWERLVREFLDYMPPRLREYDKVVLQNRIFKARTQGIGACTRDEGIEWGMTGPMLRACGFEWDFRKKQPYSGYEQFEFDIPVGERGDMYDRALVRVAEMRQSLRIMEQCLRNMPGGPVKSDHPLTTPPQKRYTMHDIETLIDHFLNVSWGPVIPPGECSFRTEGTKGAYSFYLVSDGNTMSYRTRVRTPSFPHLQMVPLMTRGRMIPDLVAILGSVDYVLADVDR